MKEESINNKSGYQIGHELNIETLAEELKKIKNKPIRQIGINFHNNLVTVGVMVSLPEIVSTIDHFKFDTYMLGYKEGVRKGIRDGISNIEKLDDRDLKKYADTTWKTKYEHKIEELVNTAIEKGGESYNILIRDFSFSESHRSLLYAGIVFIWCCFEVCMKDLWEIALNTGNKLVTKNILRNIINVDRIGNSYGIQGKYINLEYLAQYDYNIANKLGSVLVHKFDFSSAYGIKDAYSCVFPKSNTIKEALSKKELIELEARRSIIVHRAGVIDAVFCKKTGINKNEINKNLQLSGEEVFNYGNITIDIVLEMIKAISSILLGNG